MDNKNIDEKLEIISDLLSDIPYGLELIFSNWDNISSSLHIRYVKDMTWLLEIIMHELNDFNIKLIDSKKLILIQNVFEKLKNLSSKIKLYMGIDINKYIPVNYTVTTNNILN